MTSKHTPGPWKWVGDELLEEANYTTVLEVQDLPEDAYPEMQCGTLVMPNEEHDRPLIAAAPDLLAACEAVDALLTEVQETMREHGWKIGAMDGLDGTLYTALAEAAFRAKTALDQAKEV